MYSLKSLLALALAALLWPLAAVSDDTDIYINNTPPQNSLPLVMFSVDYRSNLTANICSDASSSSCTQATYFRNNGLAADIAALGSGQLVFFDLLRLSLKLVLQKVSGVKIGLMFNHNDENGCIGFSTNPNCSNGGTILMGFQTLDSTDSLGARATFLSKLDRLKALKPNANSADHPYQGSELFFEFFRYLTGQGIYNGHNGGIDYESGNAVNRSTNSSPTGVYAPASWDPAIETGVNYLSPLIGINACTKIFTVNFLFQVSQSEAQSQDALFAAKSVGGIGVARPSSQNDFFPTTLRFLNQADLADGTFGTAGNLAGQQSVTSYFFVADSQINTTTTGYALAGGTNRPYPLNNDPGALVANLTNIFQQILSVSTTFVSASVPVNVFNRASLVDNVYIALFQAAADGKPYWNGDIKKLKITQNRLADGSVDTFFADALGNSAIGSDGRINFNALTFWTNGPSLPPPPSDPNTTIVAGRDGREVPRGGAGQKIPGFISGSPGSLNSTAGARQLFYDSSATSLLPLNADNTTATALQSALTAVDSTEALTLLRYARGLDVDDINLNSSTTDARPWIFGDPLHSRPLPINYGAANGYTVSNPGIYIAVASNDGYLRLIRNTNTDATESGAEVWAFMPRSVMAVQKILRSNTPLSPVQHPYAFDGAPAIYVNDANNDGSIKTADSDKVYLYASLRRGGRAYYALDVTNPDSPSLLWTIDNTTTGFSELGLSFSTPRVGTVRIGSTLTPVVFFAGGYDTNKDAHALGSNDTKGRAIYVVNATTGALIWKAAAGATIGYDSASKTYAHTGMQDSIPSDLAIADTDGDASGLTDRILVADTGGKVWRVDLTQDGVIANWKLTLLAKLGRKFEPSANNKTNDRRFFYPPDIVQSRDSIGNYDAVILGSGDREDPLDKGGVTANFLYVVKDRTTGIGGATDQTTTHATLADVSDNCLQGGVTSSCDPDLRSGWKIALTQVSGEKNLAAAVTFSGSISFNTYLPSVASSTETQTCGPVEGKGLRYVLSLKNGTAVQNFNLLDDGAGSDHTTANSANDRFESLLSSGIPGQSVFISTIYGVKEIPPDNTPRDAAGTNRFQTFWLRQQKP